MFPFRSYGTVRIAAFSVNKQLYSQSKLGDFLVIIACKNKSFGLSAFLTMKLKTIEIKRFT